MPDTRIPAARAIAMPADTNPAGDIFGGWLVSQMDLAGSLVAAETARGRVVTVSIASMTFTAPVFVGDLVSVYAEIAAVGRTSIQVDMESWARRPLTGQDIKVTEGRFVYVAVDADRKPRPVEPRPPSAAP